MERVWASHLMMPASGNGSDPFSAVHTLLCLSLSQPGPLILSTYTESSFTGDNIEHLNYPSHPFWETKEGEQWCFWGMSDPDRENENDLSGYILRTHKHHFIGY